MNLRYSLLLLVAVVVIFTALLLSERSADPSLVIPYVYSPENSTHAEASSQHSLLRDTTAFWQVIAQHTQSSKGLTAVTETLSAGLCVFDANQDGWMDLFVVGGSGFSRHYGKKSWWNNSGGNRLLINQHGKSFIDKTKSSGLDKRQWGTGCAIADFDLDGLQDIIVTGYGQNRIFKQTSLLKFKDVTQSSGIDSNYWSNGAAIGDFNNDGLLDLYITNFVQFEKSKRTLEQGTGFKLSHSEKFSPKLYDPEPNRLYQNVGDFHFKSVEKKMGVENAFGRSLHAKWHDFNHDGWLDLLVINDFNSPNQIYLNNAGKTFSPAPENYASFHLSGSRDIAILSQKNESAYFFSRAAGQSNVLLTKDISSNNRYVDVARSSQLSSNRRMSENHWGAITLDINNDGLLDIYQTSGSLFPDQESIFVTQRQTNRLYINQGNQKFDNAQKLNSFDSQYSSRGVASVDLDNDGQLELVIANNNGPIQILSNLQPSKNNWLGLTLFSDKGQVSAQQAKVEITSADGVSQFQLDFKQSLFTQSDPRLHIGLGPSNKTIDIKVTWPDGTVAQFLKVDPNFYYRLNKSSNTLIKSDKQLINHQNKMIELAKESTLETMPYLINMASYLQDTTALKILWSQADANNKIKLLKRIADSTSAKNQAWLYEGLRDENTEVVLLALRIFKQKEWDHSIVHLLPLFKHENENVVCSVADVFAFFFDEEEAVPERKYLAIVPIMKALVSSSEQVQICLLNALASSESKRAVLSVLDILHQSKTPLIKSHAIKTLGLLRDARAVDEILSLFVNKQSPLVVSAALIALKRLSEVDFDYLYDQTFFHSLKENDLVHQFYILDLLLSQEDGVVINKSRLINTLKELSQLPVKAVFSAKIINAMLHVMANTHDSSFQEVAMEFMANKKVKQQAILTLLKIATVNNKHFAENELMSLPDDILFTALSEFSKQNISLSSRLLSRLVKRSISDTTFLHTLFSLEKDIGQGNLERVFVAVIKLQSKQKVIIDMSNYAIKHKIKGQIAVQKTMWHPNKEALLYYLQWQYTQDELSNNALLKLRVWLNQLLREDQISKALRLSLLLTASKKDVFVAIHYLNDSTFNITDQQIASVLINTPLSQFKKEQITFFERLLSDKKSDKTVKLMAASMLMAINLDNADKKKAILAQL